MTLDQLLLVFSGLAIGLGFIAIALMLLIGINLLRGRR